MKTSIATTLMFASILMTACQDDLQIVDGLSVDTTAKQFKFTVKGDFTNKWKSVTRGTLTADGTEITDLWVLDYQNGALVQQLHQESGDKDFGTPSLNLNIGNHHIYFVASSGTSPTLSTTDHTIKWETVNDTFYKDLSLTVESSTNGTRNVTLDRSVTKLKLTIADAVEEGTTGFYVTPHVWYYGIDYFTGRPAVQKIDKPIFVDCSMSSFGQTNTEVSVFGFSSSTEWKNDVAFYATDGVFVLAQVNIDGAPFKRNRATEYCGPLYGSTGNMTLTLNSIWEDSETGTW